MGLLLYHNHHQYYLRIGLTLVTSESLQDLSLTLRCWSVGRAASLTEFAPQYSLVQEEIHLAL